MHHKFDDCSFCGGLVEERQVRVDYRIGDTLSVINGVPAGVCRQCGEQYYTARVAKMLEKLTKSPAQEALMVPVHYFPEEEATA